MLAALDELDGVSLEGLPPTTTVGASVTETGPVTMLVCRVECPSHGTLRRWFVGTVLRPRMLRVLDVACSRIRRRATALAGLPVVVGTALVSGGRVLAQQRAYPAAAEGRWELPGGRVEPGEAEAVTAERECLEELGVRVRVGVRVGPDVPLYGGLLLRVYSASLVDGQVPVAREHLAVRWLGLDELDSVDWLEPDLALVPAVRELLTPGGRG